MANRFDVVAIEIEDKRPIVIRMVVLARPGQAVVLSTRGQRGGVKRVHDLPVGGGECDVHRSVRLPHPYPEVWFAPDAKSRALVIQAIFGAKLHDQLVSERRQSRGVEALRRRVILGAQTNVIEHPVLRVFWHAGNGTIS